MDVALPDASANRRRIITLIVLILATLAALALIFPITPLSLLIMVSGPDGSGTPSFGTNLVGYVGIAYAVIAILAPIVGWVLFVRRTYLWALAAGLFPLGFSCLWLASFGLMAQ